MSAERVVTNADARVNIFIGDISITIVKGDISITIGPLNQSSRAVSVKVEVAVLGSPSLIVRTVFVDVK